MSTRTSFIAGNIYPTSATLTHGTSQATTTTSKPVVPQPENFVCHAITEANGIFLDHTNTSKRYELYFDANGAFIYPYGRFPGAPVCHSAYTTGKDQTSGAN
jgi:hypothetical protein